MNNFEPKYHTVDQFNDTIKTVNITDADVKALKSRWKLTKDDKYAIKQLILEKFDIKSKTIHEKIYEGKEITRTDKGRKMKIPSQNIFDVAVSDNNEITYGIE